MEPSPSPCSLTHQPNSVNESTEDSYVMQMLTSPSSVVQQSNGPSSPTSLNNANISATSGGHRHVTSSAPSTTVAISPEEVAMRMLDYYTVHMQIPIIVGEGKWAWSMLCLSKRLMKFFFKFFYFSRVTRRAETTRKLAK